MSYDFNATKDYHSCTNVNCIIHLRLSELGKLNSIIIGALQNCRRKYLLGMSDVLSDELKSNHVNTEWGTMSPDVILDFERNRHNVVKSSGVENIYQLANISPFVYIADIDSVAYMFRECPEFFKTSRSSGVHIICVNCVYEYVDEELMEVLPFEIKVS